MWRTISPLKWLEQTRLVGLWNTWAAIGHPNGDLRAVPLGHDLDGRVAAIVFLRVLHEIRERAERLHEIKTPEQQRVAGLEPHDELLRA